LTQAAIVSRPSKDPSWWEAEQVYKLLDSLMRDYPIGAFLLWKPGSELQVRTRRFVRDHIPGQRHLSGDEAIETGTYLVLDGQQRLQSLYLAFFGSYDAKRRRRDRLRPARWHE